VQEYAAPSSVDETKAAARLKDIMTVLPHALARERANIVLKIRSRQKGTSQYHKLNDRGEFIEVREGPCRFLVNMTDYLDTGLFLDHRPTRAMLADMAQGRRFLNLFCYTGTATVHAALGGASATTSVDMSATYLDWAQRNLELNGIRGREHRLVRADCLEWIDACGEKFDLIFLDPPTFSNSKRMEGTFDVQRDHVAMLKATARLLGEGGVLVFSCNRLKFKLDTGSLGGLAVEDISKKTIQPDFERNPRIHQCWKITMS
jgi:23S rRNA (guanine2445-N2)-methyltransferase / 23S rRNA (guanine2069-N7)-methyltransferase